MRNETVNLLLTVDEDTIKELLSLAALNDDSLCMNDLIAE